MSTLRGLEILLLCLTATLALAVNNKTLWEAMDSNNQFGSIFFNEVGKVKQGNLIVSPLSASLILTLTAQGAARNTRKQMDRVLHLPADENMSGFQQLVDTFNNVKDVELNIANKIFVQQDCNVKQAFQHVAKSVFRTSAENVNFADNHAAVKTVNDWCEAQTNHRIKDLMKPSDVNGLTRIVLANAVYFKGNWKKQFEANQTIDRPFHVSTSVVKQVPMMFRKDKFKYGLLPEMKARFVEIPYKNEHFSMLIILPDDIDGLSKVEAKLAHTNIANITKHAQNTEVELFLPKFKIESDIELNDILKKMGMNDMFDARHADFSGITAEPVSVTKVVQKAFIEVNEEGSEATAATGIVMVALSLTYPEEFEVNRPFYYAILGKFDDKTIPLFVGHVVEPSNN